MQIQIPQNWQKVKLEEITEKIYSGGTPNTTIRSYWNGRLNWLSSGETGQRFIYDTKQKITEEGVKNSSTKLAKKGDVVIASAGQGNTRGQVSYLKTDTYINQSVICVRGREDVLDSSWIFYNLSNRYKELRIISDTTSIRGSLTTKIFNDLDIFFPVEIKEQQKVVSILSTFDDKIEVNNKIAKTLEQMAQTIFKILFKENVKLEAEDAKLINISKMSDSVQIISGYPFSSKLYSVNKKALGVVTIKNVQDGNFITDCDSFIKEIDIPKNIDPECLISDGDILMSLTGNVGRVCFVYGGKYLLNQRVAKLKPLSSKNIAFFYFLFRQPSIQNLMINMAKGSAQPNLSPVEVSKISLSISSREVLDKFNEIASPIYLKLVSIAKENQKLAEMRDLLLPKLMRGEIRA